MRQNIVPAKSPETRLPPKRDKRPAKPDDASVAELSPRVLHRVEVLAAEHVEAGTSQDPDAAARLAAEDLERYLTDRECEQVVAAYRRGYEYASSVPAKPAAEADEGRAQLEADGAAERREHGVVLETVGLLDPSRVEAAPCGPTTPEDAARELARLRAENEALRARLAEQPAAKAKPELRSARGLTDLGASTRNLVRARDWLDEPVVAELVAAECAGRIAAGENPATVSIGDEIALVRQTLSALADRGFELWQRDHAARLAAGASLKYVAPIGLRRDEAGKLVAEER